MSELRGLTWVVIADLAGQLTAYDSPPQYKDSCVKRAGQGRDFPNNPSHPHANTLISNHFLKK